MWEVLETSSSIVKFGLILTHLKPFLGEWNWYNKKILFWGVNTTQIKQAKGEVTQLVPLKAPQNYEPLLIGGILELVFDGGLRPEIWNPYPYLRIFPLQKRLILWFFLKFRKSGPFLKVFLPQKMADFTIFSQFLWNGTPLLWIFLTKWDSCLRIFGEKVTHLGGKSLYICLNMWVPPRCGSK